MVQSFVISPDYQEQYIAATIAALTALPVESLADIRGTIRKTPVVEVTADGADVVLAFGGSDVEANLTVNATTRKRDAGMFLLKDGAVLVFDITEESWTHASTITPTGTGNVIVRFGYRL